MAEEEHNVALHVKCEHFRPPLNLLLLAGADEGWTHAVQTAARLIGGVSLREANSVNEAISHLVLGHPNYSHLLVKSDVAGNQMADLERLTAGESHGGTALVMLGTQGGMPPRSSVATHADIASLMQAIVSAEPDRRAGVPPLQLDELYAALGPTQLHTRYQPIVRLSDRHPVGLEVLARLDHPAHGTLSPQHFIPQMELAGLSRRLTEGVIARAFHDYANDLAPLGLWLALNVPLDVMMDQSAMLWLEQLRVTSGIAASEIIIELTESRPISALDATGLTALRQSIARLRASGCGIAIDDFGPAMGDCRLLFDLGFSAVKLDKGLVEAAGIDSSAEKFLMETVAAGHTAGLSVVAEGVRDEATWTRMSDAGVDQAQGFVVARPLPSAAVQVWMQAWQGRRH